MTAATRSNPAARVGPATRRLPWLSGLNRTLVLLELRRLLRNRRTIVFTLLMPIVFFLLFGTQADYADQDAGNGNVAAYVMVSMATYGAMIAATSGGAMVAVERALGWSRQLRLTPLAPAAYVLVKLLLALALGAASVVAVYAAGIVNGRADMPLHVWVETALIAWVGSLVFAAFGLFMGYLLPSENVMQVLGPALALLAFLGGLFVPLQSGSTMDRLAQLTPMYGLNNIVHAPLTGDPVQAVWVLNVVVWLVVFTAGAIWRFRRDTARV